VKIFDAVKTRMIGLPYGEKNCDNVLSRFHLIPERHGRTDGQTDRQTDWTVRQNWYINIARQCVLKMKSSSATRISTNAGCS